MSKFGYNKVQREFEKRKEFRLQEKFNSFIAYGAGYYELQLFLWIFLDFNASVPTIRRYAKLRGLWERRQTAMRARPRREYKKQKKWSVKDYVSIR